MALVFTSVALAAGYRCTPCSQNYYCQAGVSHECPPETPVTIGTGAKSASECITCAQRDGESYPFYDEISGDCMACWQVPETTTPYWNGTACSACPENTEWDSEGLTCKEVENQVAYAFEIPHGNTTLYLVESVDDSVFGSSAPQSAAEETTEFLSTYGIANTASEYPDLWAGAMKYCQDKGLRLPTMDELVSIMNVVYGTNNTCTTACNNVNSQYVGAQTGKCDFSSLTVANQSLRNFLGSNSTTTSVTSVFYLWSSAEDSYYGPYFRSFFSDYSSHDRNDRNVNHPRALCVR